MAAREAGRAEVWNTSVAAQSPSRTCWEMRRNWLQLSEPQWRARQPSLQNAGEGFQGESSRFRFLPSFSLKYGALLQVSACAEAAHADRGRGSREGIRLTVDEEDLRSVCPADRKSVV